MAKAGLLHRVPAGHRAGLGFVVSSLDLGELSLQGGAFLQHPNPSRSNPTVAWVSHCRSPEG